MQSTASVSEGCFLSLPPNFKLSNLKKSKKRKLKDETSEPWESTFNSVWKATEQEILDINDEVFCKVVENLVAHLKKLYKDQKPADDIVPCNVLLMGSNLPDHKVLLSVLSQKINNQVTPYVAKLWSRDCNNMKNTVRQLVQQLIPTYQAKDYDSEEDGDDLEELMEEVSPTKVKLQAGQYNFSTLAAWYENETEKKSEKPAVVVVLPDFESFFPSILSDLIRLLSVYQTRIPLALVLCVATTPAAVHQSLPRDVLSLVMIELFHSEPSTTFLNNVIEKVFFSEKFPFRLGSKCMTFLTDVFLFHSFSVQGFIQGLKFCMMEHFYKKNHLVVCCPAEDIEKQTKLLSSDDIESFRRLPSFQKFVEASSKEDRKLLLLDETHTRTVITELLKDLHEYTTNFHVVLRALHLLTNDVPQAPLGKHLREYYCKAVSVNINEQPELKDAMKLLKIQSLSELMPKVKSLVDLLKISSLVDILSLDKTTKFDDIIVNLETFQTQFSVIASGQNHSEEIDFEGCRQSLLAYLQSEVLEKLLLPPSSLPLYEVMYFDDVSAVRRRLSGAPRGAIHNALNDPHYYLECECCKLPEPGAVLGTMPDLSIAYKLHLESNKLINMYDWLQAFASAVGTVDSSSGEVDKEVQARFTRAVSELQFLGFIKPSRTKVDHVTRLTWGNS